jgi:hypothetical protein
MPYYVYVMDSRGDWIQRGPYVGSGRAQRKAEKMEEATGREVHTRQWSTWDPRRARAHWKDEDMDRVGPDVAMRRFSSSGIISKEKDVRPRSLPRSGP